MAKNAKSAAVESEVSTNAVDTKVTAQALLNQTNQAQEDAMSQEIETQESAAVETASAPAAAKRALPPADAAGKRIVDGYRNGTLKVASKEGDVLGERTIELANDQGTKVLLTEYKQASRSVDAAKAAEEVIKYKFQITKPDGTALAETKTTTLRTIFTNVFGSAGTGGRGGQGHNIQVTKELDSLGL